MIEMLIRLSSCHVLADLYIYQSQFSFEHESGQHVISVPPYNKSLFSNGITCVRQYFGPVQY